MTPEVTSSTHYIGKVLSNGYLEITKTIIEQMGLKHGDEVEVDIRKVLAAPAEGETIVPEDVRALIEELVGAPKGLKETIETLTSLATEMTPPKKQRRLSHLLWKNQDGTITAKEEQELDALITEGQEGTIRKAKAILALKHLGIDIIPDLEARVEGK